MSDQRPGLKINDEGVCYPCLAAERAKNTDWRERGRQLLELCKSHRERHKHDPYDCIIPVSGGKDSHVQTQVLKAHGMRPLLVSVGDWFSHTKAGGDNFRNLCDEMDCDSMLWRQSPARMREMCREAFFSLGCPTWPIDAAIYSVPLRIAKALGIELICYGEDIAYTYGGPGAIETPSAARQTTNDVVKAQGYDMLEDEPENWLNEASPEGLEPIYLSYFIPWDGRANAARAMATGFRGCANEWDRQGCIEQFDQIDSIGYMVHPWLKYPKYGHARATDVACNWIRHGYITRDQGVDLVLDQDHRIDPRALDDFLAFTGIGHGQFWDRVHELYKWSGLFDRVNGVWRLREPVAKHPRSTCHATCGERA
jgi:N-acetyl sugar amidotransferase